MEPHDDQYPPRPRGRGIYLLPNLFTTGGLFGGFFAIIAASQGRIEAACVAIFIAAILDGIDGRVARMTNTQTEFGVQYDSLADLISFGMHCGWLASTARWRRSTSAGSLAWPVRLLRA